MPSTPPSAASCSSTWPDHDDHDPGPAARRQIAHQKCFCERGHGQAPGKCHDDHGRFKGTYNGAAPALTVAVVMATLSPGEGLLDSGEAVGLPPAAGAQAVPERYAH